MKYIDVSQLAPNKAYKWMTSVLVPRPIAWILTENDDGSRNLAPFSFFNGVSSEPPIVMVSFYPKSTEPQVVPKDTLRNIMKNKEATIHIASFAQMGEVNRSGYDIEYGASELDGLGLTIADTVQVKCGRITEAPVAMEAVYRQHVDVGDTPCTVVFMQIVGIHVSDSWEHSADIAELDPLLRLGVGEYGRVDMGSIVGRNRIIKPKK